MNTAWLEAARIFVLYLLPWTVAIGTLVLFFRVLKWMKRIETRFDGTEKDLRQETAAVFRRLTSLESEVTATSDEQAKAVPSRGDAGATTRAKALKIKQ